MKQQVQKKELPAITADMNLEDADMPIMANLDEFLRGHDLGGQLYREPDSCTYYVTDTHGIIRWRITPDLGTISC